MVTKLSGLTAMLLFALAGSAQTFQQGDLWYKVTDTQNHKVEVAPNNGTYNINSVYQMTEITIPASVNWNNVEYSVEAIGEKAFYYCKNLQSLTIQEGVEEIKPQSFYFTDALKKLYLPASVKTIGRNAFQYSGLVTLDLPEGLVTIGDDTFNSNKSLISVTIPETVTSVGTRAFADCPALVKAVIKANLTAIPDQMFRCYNSGKFGVLTTVNIPATVKAIGTDAFSYNQLKEVELPEGLEILGKKAFFSNRGLMKITLPNGLKSIGESAFEDCYSLTEITIPGTVQEWDDASSGARTFYNCKGLKKIVLEEGITRVPKRFLGSGTSTTSVVERLDLPSTLISIGETALDGGVFVNGAEIIIKNDKSIIELKENSFGYNASTRDKAYERCNVTVPSNMIAAYEGNELWSKFQNISAPYMETPEAFLNVLGEGGSYVSLTTHWGDDLAIDNLKSAIRFDGNQTVESVLETALKSDSRFYALKNSKDSFIAFGFDTNGDGSASITANGKKLDLKNGIATTTEGLSDVKSSSPYDHWALNSEEGKWKVYINGNTADFEDTVSPADNIVLIFNESPEAINYEFYLRPETQRGLWMQPEITFDTSNGKEQYFPMISNMITTEDLQQYSPVRFSVETPDGETTTAISVYLANALAGGNKVRLTASADATVVIRPYFYVNANGWTSLYTDTPTEVTMKVAHPVTDIRFEGWPDGKIRLYDMFAFRAYTEPTDADFTTVIYELSDDRAGEVFAKSAYAFDHFFAHNTGRYTLTAKTPDGKVSKTISFTIIDRERTDENDFTNGTLWLSEEWFGHSNGSINYIYPDDSMLFRTYEMVNPYEGFGCTSQYGIIYADKLIVMSKQYQDGGAPRTGGGRLTVADARTLKKLASVNDLGNGDGRACVGVNPHKAYIGAVSGIGILDLDNFTYNAKGISGLPTGGSSYSSQYGDMVCAGNRVFVVRQSTGLIVINTENDTYEKTIENAGIQGVTRTADGNVWYVDYTSSKGSHIYCIDPETLEEKASFKLPANVSCQWSTWRSTNFYAAKRSNKLFWNNNYCWDMDEAHSPENLQPIVTSDDERWPVYLENKKQAIYGSARYDDRTGKILWAGCPGMGTDARFCYYNFTDIKSGDIRSIHIEPDYYYFPAIPIFPDKYAPALIDESYKISFESPEQDKTLIELNKVIDDADDSPSQIHYTLVNSDSKDEDPIASFRLEGTELTVTPLKVGATSLGIKAESNGKEETIVIPVLIGDEGTLHVQNVSENTGSLEIKDGTAVIRGFEDSIFNVYDINGRLQDTFKVFDSMTYYRLQLAAGVYIFKADNGESFKLLVK